MKKLTALCLCAALLLGASACGSEPAPQESEAPALQTVNSAYNEAAQSSLTYVGDYATLLSAISAIEDSEASGAEAMGDVRMVSGAQVSGGEYGGSPTLTAHDGYLYMLSSGKLLVYAAAGPDTKKVAEVKLGYDRSSDEDKGWNYEGKIPDALYISGDRLAAVSEYYAYRDFADSTGEWVYDGSERTYVDIYDISDPSSPRLTESLGQDGILTGARLEGSALYVTSRWRPSAAVAGDPGTFVPSVYAGESASAMAAERVAIMPSPDSDVYSVACVYDLESGAAAAAETVLGADGDVYFDGEGICFSSQVSGELRSQPREESVYSVVDCSVRTDTFLCRLDTSGGGLKICGVSKLSGAIADCAVSVSGGRIMAVTETDGYDYSIYTDQEKGFVNETERVPADSAAVLSVVDCSAMNTVAAARLLEGDTPQDIWFDGSRIYFSTSGGKPVSQVDVSQPASPRMAGELKMSTLALCLSSWSDGRVFGIGTSSGTDAADMEYNGMRLVMYDNSRDSALSVLSELPVDDDLSEALDNPGAMLIDSENFIIAFPAGTCYDIYGWTESQGFFLRSRVETGEDWSLGVRGANAGGYEYLVGADGVTVIDMNRFIVAARADF